MPQFILTPAQIAAIEAAVADAIPFSAVGPVSGLTNGVAYRAISYSLSEPFSPIAAPELTGTDPVIGALFAGQQFSSAITWPTFSTTAPPLSDPLREMSLGGAWTPFEDGRQGAAGETLTVRETRSDAYGNTLTLTSNSVTVQVVAPEFLVLPSVGGTAQVGQTLTGDDGTVTGTAPIGYARRWLRDGVAISGATAATYVLVTADLAALITFEVTATNASGTPVVETSAAVGPVIASGTGQFLLDTFSGEAVTIDLNAHTSDSGHTWAKHPSSSTRVMRVTPQGTAYLLTANPDVIYFASAVPPSADIEVTASVVNFTLVSDNQHSIALRVSETQVTGYFAVINMRANGERVISLNRRLNGVTTEIGVSALITDWQVNVPKELRLRAVGDQITVLLDGVQIITVTDNQVTAAGRIAVGGRQSAAPSASTGSLGVHLTSISAAVSSAPPVEPAPSDITFTPATVDENAPPGSTVGSFA